MTSKHQHTLSRRGVLKYAGLAAVAVGGSGLVEWNQSAAQASGVTIRLYINSGLLLMIDGSEVFLTGYGSTPQAVEVPGGVIAVAERDTVRVIVTNNADQPHAFTVPGVVDTGPIAPGADVSVTFTAPDPGTYLYSDRLLGTVNQSQGLHGALIVMPTGVTDRLTAGGTPFVGQFSWVFNEIDPVWGQLQQGGRAINPQSFDPRYFTINGRSGVLSARLPETAPRVRLGETTLIRMNNAGQAPKSIHFHGNHVVLQNYQPNPDLVGARKDTVMVPPGVAVDVILPATPPLDAYPPVTRGQSFPVHDHIEMTQTANGGLYPAGLVTDWHLL